MKKLNIILLSLLSALSVQAATYSTNLAGTNAGYGATTGLIITNQLGGGFVINSITIANSGSSNGVYRFYDSPNPGWILWTNSPGGVTNVIQYSSNQVQTVTNFYGVVQTTTNTVLISLAQTNAAIAYNRPDLVTLAVSNGVTTTYTPPTPLIAGRGIAVTNSGTGTITLNYSTLP